MEVLSTAAASSTSTKMGSMVRQSTALADEILGERSGATDAPNAVTHTCQLPANLPCEDVFYAAVFEIAVTCTRAGAPGLYLTDMQDHGRRKCSVAYCHCS